MATNTKRKVVKRKVHGSGPASHVQTIVNGQVTGSVVPNGSIGDALNTLARDSGLKSYSARVNGVPITSEQAAGPLAGAKSIEIFAKDTRG